MCCQTRRVRCFSPPFAARRRTPAAKSEAWSRVLAVALEGRSFSDIDRDVKAVRRKAALSGESVDVHLPALLQGYAGTKAARIALAAELVGSGLLSQRAAHELTGVARETIRARTARRPMERGHG